MMKYRVRFDTSAFVAAHGRKPRGVGVWGFVFGKPDCDDVGEVWFTPHAVTYTEAKTLARAEAQRRRFLGGVRAYQGEVLVGVAS